MNNNNLAQETSGKRETKCAPAAIPRAYPWHFERRNLPHHSQERHLKEPAFFPQEIALLGLIVIVEPPSRMSRDSKLVKWSGYQ